MKKIFIFAGAVALMFAGLSAPQAHAGGMTVTLTQQGGNVVATGSGAVNLSGWVLVQAARNGGGDCRDLVPNPADVAVEGTTFCNPSACTSYTPSDIYQGMASGPAKYGPGGATSFPNSTSGDVLEFACFSSSPSAVALPAGYVSGASLSDSSTWDNSTFASLGVTPGTYVWMWGSGANQGFILDVMEPGALALFAAGLPSLGFVMWRCAAPLA